MSENEMKQVGNLEEKGIERRERIKTLKRKLNQTENTDETYAKNDTENSIDSIEQTEISLPKPIFRSYKPQHESLNSFVLENAKPESGIVSSSYYGAYGSASGQNESVQFG